MPQPTHAHLAVQQLEDTGYRLRPQPDRLAGFDHLTNGRAGRRRHGDNHLVNPVNPDDASQRLRVPEHENFVDPRPELRRVVVEERHGLHPELRVPLQFPDDHCARIAGADDQDTFVRRSLMLTKRPAPRARPDAWLVDNADRHPDAADDQQRQKGVDNEDRPRELLDKPERQRETDEQRHRDGGGPGCEHDGIEIANGRIAPVATIQTEPGEDGRLDEERGSQKGREFRTVFKEPPIETKDKGTNDRTADGREVGEEHVAVTHECASDDAAA